MLYKKLGAANLSSLAPNREYTEPETNYFTRLAYHIDASEVSTEKRLFYPIFLIGLAKTCFGKRNTEGATPYIDFIEAGSIKALW